jgi:N-methylhydantoinase A/oxoprolinase/acetone carboxylase beta subunit
MSVHTTSAPLARRPSRWSLMAAATVAAGATAIVLSLTVGGGSGTTRLAPAAPAASVKGPAWLMSLTPARLAAGALCSGYALPSTTTGPTTASVLTSMSPQTRRYTKAVTSLTFAQLAAGAAGSP